MATWDPRANDLFLETRGLPTPDERRAFLDRACGGDDGLRAEVESLLAVDARAGDFLERPAGGEAGGLPIGEVRPGAAVGPYTLLERIGEGGMGTVYLAEQTHPVARRVAVKVVKAGTECRAVLARFEVERQALARMDHPNIARVLDAGAAPDGRPYFAMELVRGVPITAHCDDRRLTPRERLVLFLDVCRAVQHAHQKGVVHRDLKPSNVLVEEVDGRPVPKVIDFGVAKAAGPWPAGGTLFTAFGAVIGTPEYMSPEQAEPNNPDVDTRSDVYALGVLLYELLTGTTPLDRARVKRAAFAEVLRAIREEDPPAPSTRLSAAGGELAAVSARRRTDPARLARLVRGELDWIVMKALEKDRARRYETADGLGDDVRRFLADEPVAAGPPSRAYRLRKLVRRNKGLVAAAAAVAAALVAGLAGTTAGFVRARQAEGDARRAEGEARRAEADARREAAAAEAARVRARAALDALSHGAMADLLGQRPRLGEFERRFLRGVLALYEQFAAAEGDTEAARAGRADGYDRVGQIQEKLGELNEAEWSYRAALALFAGLAADFPRVPAYRLRLAGMHADVANVLTNTRRFPEADAAYRDARAVLTRLVEEYPAAAEYREELARVRLSQGALTAFRGGGPDEEAAYRDAVTALAGLTRDRPDEASHRHYLALALSNLAAHLGETDRMEEAEKTTREALALREGLARENPADPRHRESLGESNSLLAALMARAGRAGEWEAANRKAYAIRAALVKDFPGVPAYRKALADACNDLAVVEYGSGRLAEAEALYREALAHTKTLHDADPGEPAHADDLAGTLINLALVARDRKDPAEVRRLHAQALGYAEAAARADPRNPGYREKRTYLRAQGLVDRGDHAAAAAAAEGLARQAADPRRGTVNAARVIAACVPLAADDGKLPADKRRAQADAYAAKAVALLRGVAAKGPGLTPDDLRAEPEFDVLRDREDYRALLADLKKSADR